jgi:4-hydroxybutyrate CoA-transferase
VKNVDATELMGTRRLWEFVHENPIVNMEPSSFTHNVKILAGIERFISVNSAVEIDLQGQLDAEAVDGTQISGIGGHFDFVQGALLSPGGKSIIAMTSTAAKGEKSRIVPRLTQGNPVTTPRHSVDYIVTEHGVAELRGRSLSQRAKALISIAHPKFSEELKEYAKSARFLK